MYGKKNLKKVDDVRSDIFMEKHKPKTNREKISCAKKLDASMTPPCEHVLLNKIRRTKFVAKIWISSIDASPPNGSPLNIGWKLVDRNYQLLWFESDLSPVSLNITYECEKHDGKYCILLLPFLLHFSHDLCINRCLDDYRNQYVFCLIGSLGKTAKK